MENMINEKKKELNNLMNEIEQNLMLLDQEDFNSVVEDYKNKKDMYLGLIEKSNEVALTDMLLSLDTLIGVYRDFNEGLCANYNLGQTCFAM
jgi:nucleoside-triphosphatase THEP1